MINLVFDECLIPEESPRLDFANMKVQACIYEPRNEILNTIFKSIMSADIENIKIVMRFAKPFDLSTINENKTFDKYLNILVADQRVAQGTNMAGGLFYRNRAGGTESSEDSDQSPQRNRGDCIRRCSMM